MEIKVKTKSGIEYLIECLEGNKWSSIRDVLLKEKMYEESVLREINKLSIFGLYLDIGANIGTHSLFFAKETLATKSIAFEMDKNIVEVFRRNMERNQVDIMVSIINKKLDKENTFDKWNSQNDFVNPSFVKIDVEGDELIVLEGMVEMIEINKPIFCVEIHSLQLKIEIDKFFERFDMYCFLNFSRYSFYRI